MNWKQFLKPDWKKIVITIALFFLFLIIKICPYSFSAANCGDKTWYSLPWETCSFHCGEPDSLTLIMTRIFLPILIIALYILSCLIVWIYDKTSKRK